MVMPCRRSVGFGFGVLLGMAIGNSRKNCSSTKVLLNFRAVRCDTPFEERNSSLQPGFQPTGSIDSSPLKMSVPPCAEGVCAVSGRNLSIYSRMIGRIPIRAAALRSCRSSMPSPSVSGLVGSVPPAYSSRLVSPSPSASSLASTAEYRSRPY